MHEAIVVKLKNVRPHPNADRLQLAEAAGEQVIVGLDNYEGQTGVYFECELQLSEEFAKVHDLVRRKNPETGEQEGGFFEENRRVRAIRLRGERSYGFWMPISCLDYTSSQYPQPGDSFTELNGHKICNKYVTPATAAAMANKRRVVVRRETQYFPMHFDTRQLKRDIREIPRGAIIYLTEKIHGTSQRTGCVLDTIYSGLWGKVRSLLGLPNDDYAYLTGTRRVILRAKKDLSGGYYGDDESFRLRVARKFVDRIYKGEVVYYEIAGFTESGTSIMADQDTGKLPEIEKEYGPKMVYDYGCVEKSCKPFVYRMGLFSEDGSWVEYPYRLMLKRAHQIGMDAVPLLAEPFIYDGDEERLIEMAEELCHGRTTQGGHHIREGVAIRYEYGDKFGILKHKSWEFLFLEGVAKENNTVDREEAS